MICLKPYKICDPVPECIETITFVLNVDSDSEVLVYFEDRFEGLDYVQKTADSTGRITIQIKRDGSTLPDITPASWNRYSVWKIWFKVDGETVDLVYDGETFQMVIIEPKRVTGYGDTYELNLTGGEVEEPEGNAFTDELGNILTTEDNFILIL